LIACEYSGATREAFRALGHHAVSCDLLPSDDDSPHHYQGDVFDIIGDGWDIMVAHPPCTYLCSSGLHWNHRTPGRAEKTEEALQFVQRLLDAPIQNIALENPRGCIGTRIRPSSQTVQPYEFGDDASKATCFWLTGKLSPLVLDPALYIPGRVVGTDKRGRPVHRWANQTDSGQNRLPPTADRWKLRSTTYAGIANAMAAQWSVEALAG
jgi:hypothetical protein